jgi:hypothetical protein
VTIYTCILIKCLEKNLKSETIVGTVDNASLWDIIGVFSGKGWVEEGRGGGKWCSSEVFALVFLLSL